MTLQDRNESWPSHPIGDLSTLMTRPTVEMPPLSPVGLSVGAPGGGEEGLELQAMLRSAAQRGVDWVLSDLADGSGAVQRRLGMALSQLRQTERPYVIARVGKIWDLSNPGATPSRILLPDVLQRSVEASLDRLGVERLDALLLDGPDEMGVPLEVSWATMLGLREAGLAGAVGLAGYPREVAERCDVAGRVEVTALDLPAGRHLLPALADWAAKGGPPVISTLRIPELASLASAPGPAGVSSAGDITVTLPNGPSASRTSLAAVSHGGRAYPREERVIERALKAGSTAVAIAVPSSRHLLPLLKRLAEARARVA